MFIGNARVSVYSTTTNKLEVKLKSVEEEESFVAGVRKDRNLCRRIWSQMRHRTAFLATPPEMWLFLVVLGLFTSFGM